VQKTPALMRAMFRCVIALVMAPIATGATAASWHMGQIRVGGVMVPGATVIAIRGDQQFTTVSDSQGVYRFTDLTDGSWTLRVEMWFSD
jgi:hypothetical protein